MNVASRDLRNDTAGLIRRVQAGEEIVITVRGEPVAKLIPFRMKTRRALPWDEFLRRLPRIQADPGLRDDLARLGGTTDELGPIQ
jgi:prevent-host-death family protein